MRGPEQATIFDLINQNDQDSQEAQGQFKPQEQTEPVAISGECMSINGLVYSLREVPGWVEVKSLVHTRNYNKKLIAERAWVAPDTITNIYKQEYKGLNKKLKKIGKAQHKPVAWGFGPRRKISANCYEDIGFDLKNLQDFCAVQERIRKKRD